MKRVVKVCILGLIGLISLVGCGGNKSELAGSVSATFKLDYDAIEIARQSSNGNAIAVIISYVKSPTDPNKREIPVKIVVNEPVVTGTAMDLAAKGIVDRVVADGAKFPPLKSGTITFTTLGKVGEAASGEFFATFDSGNNASSTLNGTFSGTVTELK